MEDAYKKSLTMTHDGLVVLQREEEIITEAMERARLEEEYRRRTGDGHSDSGARDYADYPEYEDPRQRREIEA